tara:strand:+ start:86682 stop:87062 length:381 start_codon:yes stop_codon:yes gene_type:complete
MNNTLRVIICLPALLFVVMGLAWLVKPASMAASLGMPLLDGLGRSTQIGDLGAFFFAGGTMVFMGVITHERAWLQAPALLLGATAIFRTLAWLIHDATLAIPQIAVEVVICLLLLYAVRRMSATTS